MIDWHSHILPDIDDGSRDVCESLGMIKALKEQGVDLVVATPHFFADDESVDAFLERRDNAWKDLSLAISEDTDLNIVLGAEVKYYSGISRMSGLERLQIGDTGLILLEMPMSKWTEYTVRELAEINSSRGLTVIIAHMERYFPMQSRKTRDRVLDSGVIMQSNASFFTRFGSKRRAISSLINGEIQLIGSDCHNMTSRPPNIKSAYDVIRKKLGEDFAGQMNEYGYRLCSEKLSRDK